jgi:hypothetical protein
MLLLLLSFLYYVLEYVPLTFYNIEGIDWPHYTKTLGMGLTSDVEVTIISACLKTHDLLLHHMLADTILDTLEKYPEIDSGVELQRLL